MANHTINIINKAGMSATTANTSAVKSITNVRDKGNSNKTKNIARGMRMLRTGDVGSLGLMGLGLKMTPIGLVAQEVIKLVSKGIDMGLNYSSSKTGEDVNVGNIRRIKNYTMNLSSYAMDATWGKRLTDLKNQRLNSINDYYQGLTGNMEYSKSYGQK